MSVQYKVIADSVFSKLETHEFIPKNMTFVTDFYSTRTHMSSTFRTLSASGKSENFQNFLQSLTYQECDTLAYDMNFSPLPGEVCPDLPVKLTTTSEEKLLHFAEDDPKVYLIDFWATWCGPCDEPMKHNQEMLENNPGWEGKAEIVAISVDNNTGSVIQRIAERGWHKVTSYWAGPEGALDEAPKKFSINTIPTCALVYKSKVLWAGHPSERNLEADINSLIEGKSLEIKEETAVSVNDFTPEAYDEMMAQALGKIKFFVEKNPNLKQIEIFSGHTVKVVKGKEPVSNYDISISGTFLDKYREPVEEIFKELKDIFPMADRNIEYIQTVPVSRGQLCNLCNNSLDPSQVQYLCIFCEPAHYHCDACHNQEREGVASAKLAHPHHLYRIGPESEALDEIRFGKHNMSLNRTYDDEPDRTHCRVSCDNRRDAFTGCEGPIIGIRYKCVHCKDYDFCETCFAKWLNPPHPNMVEMANLLEHFKSHVWAVMHYPS